MQPIGPLMIEHRLIERMIHLISSEAGRVAAGGALDAGFVRTAVDFIRTYADRCHHGKEEDILFRDLAKKNLSAADRAAMDELVRDHVWARGRVAVLVEAAGRAEKGDAAARTDAAAAMKELAEFYPPHIRREDQAFFPAAMKYLGAEEQRAMLSEEFEFDRKLIHDRYREVVAQVEKR